MRKTGEKTMITSHNTIAKIIARQNELRTASDGIMKVIEENI